MKLYAPSHCHLKSAHDRTEGVEMARRGKSSERESLLKAVLRNRMSELARGVFSRKKRPNHRGD